MPETAGSCVGGSRWPRAIDQPSEFETENPSTWGCAEYETRSTTGQGGHGLYDLGAFVVPAATVGVGASAPGPHPPGPAPRDRMRRKMRTAGPAPQDGPVEPVREIKQGRGFRQFLLRPGES